METTELLQIIKWGFGICAGGFFTLAGWLYALTRETVTSKQILAELKDIKLGLFGDMNHIGLVAEVRSHANDIEEMKKHCKEIQAKKDPLYYSERHAK